MKLNRYLSWILFILSYIHLAFFLVESYRYLSVHYHCVPAWAYLRWIIERKVNEYKTTKAEISRKIRTRYETRVVVNRFRSWNVLLASEIQKLDNLVSPEYQIAKMSVSQCGRENKGKIFNPNGVNLPLSRTTPDFPSLSFIPWFFFHRHRAPLRFTK